MKKNWTQPYRIHWGYLYKGERREYSDSNWWRYSSYLTKWGVVLIQEYQHQRRDELMQTTEFETVLNGTLYRMSVDRNDLSEKALKDTATRFLKECLQQSVNQNNQ